MQKDFELEIPQANSVNEKGESKYNYNITNTCASDVIPVEHICLPSENWGSTSIAFANAKMDCAREAKRGTVELKK